LHGQACKQELCQHLVQPVMPVCNSSNVTVKTSDSNHSTVMSSRQRQQQRHEACENMDIKELHSKPTLASTLSSSLVICVCSKTVVFCSTLASSAVQNIAHECLHDTDDVTHWVSGLNIESTMGMKVLTCQCVFWPAHMDQQVRSNTFEVLFQVLHRLQQELGSVVASLLAAMGCGTKVAWVKAIQWDDLHISRRSWSIHQEVRKLRKEELCRS